MRVKVEKISAGLHPSESVVAIETEGGREELVVGNESLLDATLSVGWPVGQRDDLYLIELPQETFRGFWRVWVPRLNVTPDTDEVRAYA